MVLPDLNLPPIEEGTILDFNFHAIGGDNILDLNLLTIIEDFVDENLNKVALEVDINMDVPVITSPHEQVALEGDVNMKLPVTCNPHKQVVLNDQSFLIDFIFSNYVGPDVMLDTPRRPASQRIAENRPPYNLNDLGPGFLNLAQLENLYYYIVRKAHQSLVLKLRPLHNYLQGKLPKPESGLKEDFQQFISYFPLNLHEQTRDGEHRKIFKGMVFIDDPDTKYIKSDDIERFKILTSLDEIKINKDLALVYSHGYRTRVGNEEKPSNARRKRSRASIEVSPNEIALDFNSLNLKQGALAVKPLRMRPPADVVDPSELMENDARNEVNGQDQLVSPSGDPSILMLTSPPMVGSSSDTSVILTGAATEVRAGPPMGVVDIGASEKAYIFRVLLPGVKKEKSRQFSCVIEVDGKVHIRGESGMSEDIVIRQGQVFEMKSRNFCPPGPFEIKFNLPGPVDPRLFECEFHKDGIFEGMVMKFKKQPDNQAGAA
ncbi:hypothetical protein GIB67_033667 [Kingdonia uniflora]|uniref:SHSP domain-containing protein n=1 Tax=Kingdonia uniflora TaxID=39325 RepID=A0A7J7P3W3_9MAGN|nr:hypothetical protein GIB67_033667 [Kingdonia uniflora]